MGILGNMVTAIAPRWKLARLRAQQAIMAYEAVMPTRTHRARRENRSPNQATQFGGRSLREQARWLDENHDLVIGALDKLEERVIGSQGIIVEPQPLTPDGKLNKELAENIRMAWAEWSVAPDVSGQYTRPVLERLLLRTWLRDGEVFVHTICGSAVGLSRVAGVPCWLEAMEPDYVPLGMSDQETNLVQGIQFNSWMRPTGYQVYKAYPGFGVGLADTKLIPAENMLHLKFTRRLNQARGVSLLSGVIIRLADLKNYEDSERIAARLGAAFGAYIKRGDAQTFEDQLYEKDKQRQIDITPGMIFDGLAPGEDIGMIKSDRPNPNLEAFRMGQLRAVAAGTRSSFSSIARNYDGTYSAQRQELVEAQEGYAILQDAFIAAISRPMYRRWLSAAISAGRITVPRGIDKKTLFNAVYSGPVMPWIDPLKEANAWKVILRGGAGTESDWIRARGGTPADVKRRRKAEIDENRELGLVFDTDPANDTGGDPSGGKEEPNHESKGDGRTCNRTQQ